MTAHKRKMCHQEVTLTYALYKNLQWTTASFDLHQLAVHKRTTILAHCNLKQNTWLHSKLSSFFLLCTALWCQIERHSGSIVTNTKIKKTLIHTNRYLPFDLRSHQPVVCPYNTAPLRSNNWFLDVGLNLHDNSFTSVTYHTI